MHDALFSRPEYYKEIRKDAAAQPIVEKPLGLWERLYDITLIRRIAILALLALAWQLYAERLNNPLLLPTFAATLLAVTHGFGDLLTRSWISLQTLLIGYTVGVLLAGILTVFATSTRIGRDLLETLTAMFNPLPAIALLPLALIWFGLGTVSILFVLIHSVLWAVALNAHSGFTAVSETLRLVGRNYGLRGFAYVIRILIPAAFPQILTGLKVGWAFAWRTLIAAELVFGVSSSGGGGLGWYIYSNKNLLETANVFAGLLTVIAIGILVETLIFGNVEGATVRRWGMQR